MKTGKRVRAVIIDDEKYARDALRTLIENYCPQIEICGEGDGVVAGQHLIRQENPDLIFLDVEMPPLTGFDLLKSLDSITADVIFTTAHDHYAIHAIKVSALDYLLKPIDKDDLINAVSKHQGNDVKITREVWELLRQQLESKKSHDAGAERLAIPSVQGYEVIKTSDIMYCEGDGNYTTFTISGREPLIASKILKEYERLLPSAIFIRVHAKYLVNINFVKRYLKGRGGSLIMADGRSIEVSQSKRQDLIDALGQ